jgi:hypothetical protein
MARAKERNQGRGGIRMIEVIEKLMLQLLAVPVFSLIGGPFLMLGTYLVGKFKPPFSVAYRACLWSTWITVAIAFLTEMVAGAVGNKSGPIEYTIVWLTGAVVYTVIIDLMIEDPDYGPIGYTKAFLIYLVLLGIGVLIVLAGLLFFVLFRKMGLV